jgi:hypothetical protein
MKSEVYLIADRHGVNRLTKRVPELSRHEVAVRLEVEIPDSCFRAPVIGVGTVTFTEDMVDPPQANVNVLTPRRRLDMTRGDADGGQSG